MKSLILLLALVICTSVHGDESEEDEINSICLEPVEQGYCLASIPRYAFMPARNMCIRFSYGGCGGNGNNFRTLPECELVCPPMETDLDDTIDYRY